MFRLHLILISLFAILVLTKMISWTFTFFSNFTCLFTFLLNICYMLGALLSLGFKLGLMKYSFSSSWLYWYQVIILQCNESCGRGGKNTVGGSLLKGMKMGAWWQAKDLLENSVLHLFISELMIYFFLPRRVFSSCEKQRLLSSCGAQVLIAVASLFVLQGPWGTGPSAVAAHGLSSCRFWTLEHRLNSCGTRDLNCSSACGIFPDLGSSLCLLHFQAEYWPLSLQGCLEIGGWMQGIGGGVSSRENDMCKNRCLVAIISLYNITTLM